MVIVKFIQDGLKCQLEGETDTYKYSKNMEMQFVKDENHQDYEVTVFFLDQEKNEGKIDIDENGVFQLGERFFLRKEPFYLSFQLEKGDEIQHLGNYKMRVCDAIGNGSSPLPENPKIWIEYVDEEMDKYFNENFQPKLDKFNADYEEIKKIAGGGGSGSSITVDSELNSTSKNPVQNQAIYKEFSNVNKKIENIPTSFKKINNTEITGDGNIDIPIVNVDAELNETSTNAIQNQAVAKELGKKIPKGGLKTINGESIIGSGDITISGESGNNAGYKLLYSKTYENVSKITENVDNINQYKDIIITVSLEIDNTIDEQDYSCILTWLVLGGVTVAYWKNVNMSKSYNYKHLIGKLKMSDDNKYIDIELSLNNSVAMLQYNNTTGVEEAKYFRRGVIMDENFQTNSLKVELNKELKEIKINIYGK